MLKIFVRIFPSLRSTHYTEQFVSKGTILPLRRLCSLTPQDTPLNTALIKILNPKQNDPSKDESNQNAVELPRRGRKNPNHPLSTAEAVNRSEFLKNMIDIGVNLYHIQEKRPLDFDFIMSLHSYDPDPPERIRFLLQLGVQPKSIAKIIANNPRILKENMEDMQVRVNYLESKKFLPEQIASIVVGCPELLTMQTRDIDARLGYFQLGYKLSGDQVRKLALTSPWLISWPERKLRDTLDTLKDRLSFNTSHMKHLILNHGRVWKKDIKDVMMTAKFLHTELNMSQRQMALQGQLLTISHLKLKFRYDFMVFMNRANFDPTKPHYHTYDILWQGTTEEFCEKLHTTKEALDLFAKSQ